LRETDVLRKLVELDTNQRFSEHVSWHFVRSSMLESNDTIVERFANVMKTDGDMLRARVESGVLRELDSRLVVAVDEERVVEDFGTVELG